MLRRPIGALLAAVVLVLAACGDDESDSPAKSKAETTQGTQAAPETQVAGTAESKEPAARAPARRRRGCADVSAPAGRERRAPKPSGELDPKKTYDVTLVTTCGDITIRLDQRTSPDTTASFVSLAKRGFFDGTTFHRIVPGFVIQGGDPTGSGSGGPGYTTRDLPPRDASYTLGRVAMAKTGTEPPGTAGSQFYIVTGANAGLPPEYALLGRVVRGLDVVKRIGRFGDPSSGELGAPLKVVVVERTRVRVS